LIKKRYCYGLFSFVMGKYKKNDEKYQMYLLNNMSFAEKIDLISMQFNQPWYRVWLNNPEKYYNIADVYKSSKYYTTPIKELFSNNEIYKLYNEKKAKFESNWGGDGGKKLRSLIQRSTDSEILWEIPKGGKDRISRETDIECAIREFEEETGIKYNSYNLLYNVKPVIDSYVDDGINYQSIYYLAMPKNDKCCVNPYIDFKNFDQISEIEQIKWVSGAEIKFLTLSASSHNKITNLFKEITNKFKFYNKLISTYN
jgi:ADP-ribose pyrophosphatase YjhB (NUDIX family)